MAELEMFTVAYNKPRLIAEQVRLLRKYLRDDFGLIVVDNSEPSHVDTVEALCRDLGVGYLMSPSTRRMHHEALNFAAAHAAAAGFERFGFLDHDVFPMRETRVVPLIDECGFYGMGQRAPGGERYIWPGLFFVSCGWLAGRKLDFGGVPNGDTGSANWPLFVDEDWRRLYRPLHSYGQIREPDAYGLQSWGYEVMGSFLHATNGSGWMTIPDPDERERLLFELLARL